MAISEIPEYSSSDPERGDYDEKRIGGEKGAGYDVRENLAESEVIEFGETKELRYDLVRLYLYFLSVIADHGYAV